MKRLAVKALPLSAVLAALALLAPQAAFAHGFGEKYDLPLPLSLYVTGAGLAVALSFVIVAVFVRRTPSATGYPRFNLLRLWPVRALASAPVIHALRVLSVLILLLVILAGTLGVNRSTANIAPVLVWVYWWVGIAFASALIGNVWGLVNPVRTVYEWIDSAAQKIIPGGLSFGQDDSAYPPSWAAWPAVIVFALFAWFEIAYEGSADPLPLAIAIIGYCMITWWGMAIFGPDAWMRNADVFSLIFGVLARLAPTELRVLSETGDVVSIDDVEDFRAAPPERRELLLRPPGAGLLNVAGTTTSYMILVVVLLSTVTFDGLQDTPPWARLVHWAFVNSPGWTSIAVTLVNTAGLVAFASIFVAAYLGFCAVMARSGEDADTRGHSFRRPRFCPLPCPHRVRLPPCPFRLLPAHPGAGRNTSRIRPVRIRLGPLRHVRLPGQHRHRQRAVRVDPVHRRHRDRPRHCRLSGARHRAAALWRA